MSHSNIEPMSLLTTQELQDILKKASDELKFRESILKLTKDDLNNNNMQDISENPVQPSKKLKLDTTTIRSRLLSAVDAYNTSSTTNNLDNYTNYLEELVSMYSSSNLCNDFSVLNCIKSLYTTLIMNNSIQLFEVTSKYLDPSNAYSYNITFMSSTSTTTSDNFILFLALEYNRYQICDIILKDHRVQIKLFDTKNMNSFNLLFNTLACKIENIHHHFNDFLQDNSYQNIIKRSQYNKSLIELTYIYNLAFNIYYKLSNSHINFFESHVGC